MRTLPKVTLGVYFFIVKEYAAAFYRGIPFLSINI